MDEDEIDFYKQVGAINAHLDSIQDITAKINKSLDESFAKLDAMKHRF